MEYLIGYGYLGVFVASFLAATILPFSSEVVLAGVLLAGSDYRLCMAAAIVGNVLGGMTCYWMGRAGKIEWIRKYLRINSDRLQRVQSWVERRGSWVSFFTFVPAVGDLITVALGFLRANVWGVFAWMTFGKSLRYILWMQLVYQFM